MEDLEIMEDLETLTGPDTPGGTHLSDAGTQPLGSVLNTVITDRGEVIECYSHHLGERAVLEYGVDAKPWEGQTVYCCSDLSLLAGLTPSEIVAVDSGLLPASAATVLPNKPELKGTEAEIWNAYQNCGIEVDGIVEPWEMPLITLVKSLAERYVRFGNQGEKVCCSGLSRGNGIYHMLARFVGYDTFIRVDAQIKPGAASLYQLTFYSGNLPVELMHIPRRDGRVKDALLGIAVNHIIRHVDLNVPWEPGAWG